MPVLASDNWWNAGISSAPVDVASASYIAFVNNGGTRRLHPDFGVASPGSIDIYGMPYAIVDGSQPKQAVTFQYWDESDGVDYATHQGVPFYPIPAQAITQPHWVEAGAPGNVDQRSDDRHLLVVDCTNKYLYELYNVYYDAVQAKWYAGSGAFFDHDNDIYRTAGRHGRGSRIAGARSAERRRPRQGSRHRDADRACAEWRRNRYADERAIRGIGPRERCRCRRGNVGHLHRVDRRDEKECRRHNLSELRGRHEDNDDQGHATIICGTRFLRSAFLSAPYNGARSRLSRAGG